MKYFSIMVNEVTDPYGNQEVLSVCLMLVDITDKKTHVREACLDFIHLQRVTGQMIAKAISKVCKVTFSVQN